VQISLILNILCGFGAAEIAETFLLGRAAVEKRLSRGKRALAKARRLFDLGDAELVSRLDTVHRALYLLFNEGYHGASADDAIRVELCQEAMRLTALLHEHPLAATPVTSALASLMFLHAARLRARSNAAGELTSLVDQDRSTWDDRLAGEGLALLEESATGRGVSSYHIEAAIAAVHAGARSVDETDWAAIVSLYDRLADITRSPVVALNRAIAVGQRDGAEAGIAAIAAIDDRERLASYPFYHAALGEFELRRSRLADARSHFLAALSVARSEAERRLLKRRLRRCGASAIRDGE
jgi:RNA polymerase sigma-70 factor (ECF subfamily)